MPWTLDPEEPHPTDAAIKQNKSRQGPNGIELDLGTGGGVCVGGFRLKTEDRRWFLGMGLLQADLFVVASCCQSSPDGQVDAVGYKVGASVGHRNGDS